MQGRESIGALNNGNGPRFSNKVPLASNVKQETLPFNMTISKINEMKNEEEKSRMSGSNRRLNSGAING